MLLPLISDELGLVAGDAVDQFQIANMVRSDTITGQSIPFAGNVLFTNPDKLGVPPRPLFLLLEAMSKTCFMDQIFYM